MLTAAKEWIPLTHNSKLNIYSLHTRFTKHAYPRHSHEYYVISVIANGKQAFMHKGAHYKTAAGGVIFINPDVIHTGETVDEYGFELYSIYPTIANIETILFDLTGHYRPAPFFTDVQINSAWAAQSVLLLYKTLFAKTETLEAESCFLQVFGQLLTRYTDTPLALQKYGNEKKTIQKARQYIEERLTGKVNLKDVANYVGLSPYYLLRTFRKEVGMLPHEYLENLRIRRVQQMLASNASLAQIAAETGFSSQSHMTRSFKKIIGVTPGQYAAQIRIK